jgi:nucleoside-diphosphate-sugar epimerase
MRALVTGAAGFVGSRVAHSLLQAGNEVHALVREPGERLAEIANAVRIERCDLMDAPAVDAIVGRVRPELCIHCAWYAVPGAYLQSPENDRQRLAALSLAQSLATHGCRRLVGVGTCFEYAHGDAPLAETSPVEPVTPYAQSKLATYRELDAQCAASGLSFAWARLFYLYGPFEDRRRLVPAVTLALLEGRPARATSGDQRRDFLHVDDVASALHALGLNELTGPVNVGSGEAVAVRDVVLHLGTLTGRPDLVELGALEQSPGDPAVVVAENGLLVEATGWTPRFTLEQGLGETVAWWSERETA